MLQRLSIRNFAIIERLDLEFDGGLSVLTGETGAGKSIILGALNLVLGGRASPELIRTGCDYAEVTAIFELTEEERTSLETPDPELRDDEELILRRQIRRGGRSRAYANDRAVSVTVLAQLAAGLVDIAGQHQHHSLLSSEKHLMLLDRFGDLDFLRIEVGEQYGRLLELVRRRRKMRRDAEQRQEMADYLRFQLDELKKADIREGEEDELGAERDLLRHSEALRGGLKSAMTLLDGEKAAVSALAGAENQLKKIRDRMPALDEMITRLESTRLELEDLGQTLGVYNRQSRSDPARLEEVEGRLAKLGRLFKKHGPGTGQLLAKRDSLESELSQMESLDEHLSELDVAIKPEREKLYTLAGKLSKKRKKAAEKLAAGIAAQLLDLGMKRTCFEVAVRPRTGDSDEGLPAESGRVGTTGMDEVEFMISPNPGEELRPLARIASGGELSRVMLAIKSVLLAKDPVALSIFDEVDAGIGGEVAHRVGAKIKELSRARQVICITHLPQITAYAEAHYSVSKENRDERTFTRVSFLETKKQREEELARMMSGEAAGTAARKAARELLAHAGKLE